MRVRIRCYARFAASGLDPDKVHIIGEGVDAVNVFNPNKYSRPRARGQLLKREEVDTFVFRTELSPHPHRLPQTIAISRWGWGMGGWGDGGWGWVGPKTRAWGPFWLVFGRCFKLCGEGAADPDPNHAVGKPRCGSPQPAVRPVLVVRDTPFGAGF